MKQQHPFTVISTYELIFLNLLIIANISFIKGNQKGDITFLKILNGLTVFVKPEEEDVDDETLKHLNKLESNKKYIYLNSTIPYDIFYEDAVYWLTCFYPNVINIANFEVCMEQKHGVTLSPINITNKDRSCEPAE